MASNYARITVHMAGEEPVTMSCDKATFDGLMNLLKSHKWELVSTITDEVGINWGLVSHFKVEYL